MLEIMDQRLPNRTMTVAIRPGAAIRLPGRRMERVMSNVARLCEARRPTTPGAKVDADG